MDIWEQWAFLQLVCTGNTRNVYTLKFVVEENFELFEFREKSCSRFLYTGIQVQSIFVYKHGIVGLN